MRTWPLALALLAAASTAATAIPATDSRVPFRTVAAGFVANGGPPRQPTLYLIRDRTDLAGLGRLVTDSDRPTLERADLQHHALIAVFAGVTPSTGYSIRIKQISLAAGLLRLIVDRRRPAPTSITMPAFSRPYHIVTTSRRLLTAHSWILLTQRGHTIARGST